nr:MAG TPA: hypothetical protein [Caudoviricetes sp.]
MKTARFALANASFRSVYPLGLVQFTLYVAVKIAIEQVLQFARQLYDLFL